MVPSNRPATLSRCPPLNWDAQEFKIKNTPQDNKYLHKKYRDGWQVKSLT